MAEKVITVYRGCTIVRTVNGHYRVKGCGQLFYDVPTAKAWVDYLKRVAS